MLDGREVRVGEAIKSRFCRARLPMRTIRGQGGRGGAARVRAVPPARPPAPYALAQPSPKPGQKPGRRHLKPWTDKIALLFISTRAPLTARPLRSREAVARRERALGGLVAEPMCKCISKNLNTSSNVSVKALVKSACKARRSALARRPRALGCTQCPRRPTRRWLRGGSGRQVRGIWDGDKTGMANGADR